MEKRSERNKQLYKEVDKKIADIAKKNSNKEFENTNNTLKGINPNLFGGQQEVTESKKQSSSPDKKLIINSIVFVILLLLIIGIAVVIYYATK